ncbi:MAG TPA: acyltransferase [Candidatus Thioglobus sp.]|nr:acyltransferase [Candidatus Thioglobus sp.]
MNTDARRHDIDWLRVIAIAILIVYHSVVSFQPWAWTIAFIQSENSLEWLWILMELVNIWRIPLLFFVSGMGVCFAMRRRDWRALYFDRLRRIFLPLAFGSLVIVPLHFVVYQSYTDQTIAYWPSMGHLWFLGNITAYVILCLPVFHYFQKSPENAFIDLLKRLLKSPLGLAIIAIPFIIEALVISPEYFSMYAGTLHGFFIGLLAFFFGFCFVSIGETFFTLVQKHKLWLFLIALFLYFIRLFVFGLEAVPVWLISIESMLWLYAIFGYAYGYLNQPSALLGYLSPAVYPIYIVHMFFQYLSTSYILKLDMPAVLQLVLIIVFTLLLSWLSYELIIKRVKYLRPLFGLSYK